MTGAPSTPAEWRAWRAWSPGWNAPVALGSTQRHVLAMLRAIRPRHPSHAWNEAPRVREYGPNPGTVSRTLHRLHDLGVIAIQATLGAHGGVRFTFGVRFWHRGPVRRGQIARMTGRRAVVAAPGQLMAFPAAVELTTTAAAPPPPPAGSFDELMVAAGVIKWW